MNESTHTVAYSTSEPVFTVTDLKQWLYCPRIVYYHLCLPDIRPTTFHMRAGKEAGKGEETREARRTLRWYGIEGGKRHYNVYLSSAHHGLRGTVDMVIETEDELIPVDFKLSRRPRYHFRLQVAAYALLLEDCWRKPVRRGFLYLIPLKHHCEIPIEAPIRETVHSTIEAMYRMLQSEAIPPATESHHKCRVCEFRRFCNDTV
ncbi:CRISPR-associated protein Cas4 [Spirochaeta thermophila DSM 6578]|uniref:CRISPR-associated exonuclease Cas4 n=1 Tax=Winmispira thermophila (strain ATCC 700085 / DSM 6578 / Z-1203) TaxID=869211 RepID=G0GAK9_WINT7|nr:CRISPR-associated protein Cas4 [Spirochaeta thermophila]AEJ60974.1 CRISPR-associated protein Cas4 [Spirochaeta thermophila DSM 6578]